MDTPEDIRMDKYLTWKEQLRSSRRDYCERDCDEHNADCPYYDPEEECWDYEECFKDSGGWE